MVTQSEQKMPSALVSVVRNPTPPACGNAGIGKGIKASRAGIGRFHRGKVRFWKDIQTFHVVGSALFSAKSKLRVVAFQIGCQVDAAG